MRTLPKSFARARRLRRAMTLPEVVLWTRLRRKGTVDMRWRRQHPVGRYILDFYCAEAKLAVEVDGMAHDLPNRADRDLRRDRWLAEQGIRVLRFPASEVLRDDALIAVLDTIAAALAASHQC